MTKNKIAVPFKFQPFSWKQLQVLTWWTKSSPVKDYDGIIADGAIRSGKTIAMSFSFVAWSNACFANENFAICGKTIGSLKRNVLQPLKRMCVARKYTVIEHRGENMMEISFGGRTNGYYFFGGKDESSQDLIQGITLAGILFDEVALMPQSFVEQGVGRCSVNGAKLWFNCNPENPFHFVKTEWIDKAKQKKLLHLFFSMDDNLSLSENTKQRYRNQFSGVFYKRFILGQWVAATGVIYDMFDDERNLFDELQLDLAHRIHRRYITIDYGTKNPCTFLEVIDDCQGGYWVTREYYYNSAAEWKQKDDAEYAEDLAKFVDQDCLKGIIIDPSAASFKIAIRKKGLRSIDADNDVEDGIRLVSTLLAQGRLHICRACINTRKEFSAYVWNDKRAEAGVEEPLKQNDHAMDALRYFVKTIVGGYRSVKKN
jgi:PBSX family phage terminase large subunit